MLNSTRIEVDLLKRMKEAGLFPKNKTILDVSFDRLILKARETMAKGK